jgi:hypothetical protein
MKEHRDRFFACDHTGLDAASGGKAPLLVSAARAIVGAAG